MAFNQFQIDELSKIEGFGKAYEKGSKQAAKVAGDVALLMIPGLLNNQTGTCWWQANSVCDGVCQTCA